MYKGYDNLFYDKILHNIWYILCIIWPGIGLK